MSVGYTLDRFPQFVNDHRKCFSYLRRFDEALEVGHYKQIEIALLEWLRKPHFYSYFKETGAPYRAKLFRVGKKTFWIIYTVDGAIVALRRFWDCAREPGTHGLR